MQFDILPITPLHSCNTVQSTYFLSLSPHHLKDPHLWEYYILKNNPQCAWHNNTFYFANPVETTKVHLHDQAWRRFHKGGCGRRNLKKHLLLGRTSSLVVVFLSTLLSVKWVVAASTSRCLTLDRPASHCTANHTLPIVSTLVHRLLSIMQTSLVND